MKKQKTYNINLFLVLFPIMIFAGKLIRWTILKSVLVDMSIGNGMISQIISGTTQFVFLSEVGMADAAGNSAAIFSAINFFGLTTTVQFEIYISFIWNIILIALLLKSKKHLSLPQFLFWMTSIAVLNIWDFCLAKEPLQMIFFLVMMLIICSKKLNEHAKFIGIIITLLLSVLTYRVYYILIVAFLIIVGLICKKWLLKLKKIKAKHIILLLIILAGSYFVMLNAIKVIDMESFNELMRVRTRLGEASTQMLNIFKSENLAIFSLDYLIMILRMLFPVELIPMGIKYWPYVFYQILISYFLIKAIISMKKQSKSTNLALYLYIAFLLASGTFEPDFGSWVRHEAAIIPVLLVMAGIIIPKEKKEISYEKENNTSN